MTYHKAPVVTAPNGPGGKPLTMILSWTSITEQEMSNIINDFANGLEDSNDCIDQIWRYLHKGNNVTLDNTILKIKK